MIYPNIKSPRARNCLAGILTKAHHSKNEQSRKSTRGGDTLDWMAHGNKMYILGMQHALETIDMFHYDIPKEKNA